jgi:hypothetical protein
MEENDVVVPTGPYQFENSSRYPKGYLENLIFSKSEVFFELERRLHHAGDNLDEHIRFLLAASKKMETKPLCPICGQAPVKFFFFLNHSLVSKELTCCDNENCREQLKSGHIGSMRSFSLGGLRAFKKKGIRRKAESLFRWALKLKKSASPQEVFTALTSGYAKLSLSAKSKAIETNQSLVASDQAPTKAPRPMSERSWRNTSVMPDARQQKLF